MTGTNTVPTPTPCPPIAACVGDCDGDGSVDTAELLRGVTIGLGLSPPAACLAFDCGADCGPGAEGSRPGRSPASSAR